VIRWRASATRRAVVSWALLGAAGCVVQMGGTQERRLVDLNDGTIERRLQIAQEYVHDQQLGVLRASARKQFPNLTDGDLATLGLRWQRAVMGDGEHVMVEVTFMPQSKGVDAKAVADFVAGRVRDDIRAKLQRVSEYRASRVAPVPPNNAYLDSPVKWRLVSVGASNLLGVKETGCLVPGAVRCRALTVKRDGLQTYLRPLHWNPRGSRAMTESARRQANR